MPYKTIILELLQARPALHDQLPANRTLLRTMDPYAIELESRHQERIVELSRSQPDTAPEMIASLPLFSYLTGNKTLFYDAGLTAELKALSPDTMTPKMLYKLKQMWTVN